MLGAIAGDIIGSVYEWNRIKTTDFPLFSEGCSFTDDTVLTVAVADAILQHTPYEISLKEYAREYPTSGYGGMFRHWMMSESYAPYNSFGNGSAMRVSPVGFAFDTLEEVLHQAEKSAEVTHNHPEGIKGAQAVAAAVFLARTGSSKDEMKAYIENTFSYDLSRALADIRPGYAFDVSCQGSVPESIIAFLESDGFESTIRLAVSLGGDSDTLACMAGGIAQAFYKEIPGDIIKNVKGHMDNELWSVVEKFNKKYGIII